MNNPKVSIEGYTDFRLKAEGAHAFVFNALQNELGRRVAVKVQKVDVEAKVDAGAFEREYRSLATLSNHPNIVTIYESGLTDQGNPYIAMELYDETLFDLVRTKKFLTPAEVVAFGVPLAKALQRAHDDGVVHCDIKPRNILISEYGEAALADFGVAKVSSESAAANAPTGYSVPYVAPEILAGAAPSVASDIYSLGATLYTALAGRQPYRVDDKTLSADEADAALVELVRKRERPDPITSQRVPPPLEQFIRNMLARDPQVRPESAAEVAQKLAALGGASGAIEIGDGVSELGDNAPTVLPDLRDRPTPSRRRPAQAVAALLSVAILGVAGFFVLDRENEDQGDSELAVLGTQESPTTSVAPTQQTTAAVPVETAATTSIIVEDEDFFDVPPVAVLSFPETGATVATGAIFSGSAKHPGGIAHVEMVLQELDKAIYWNPDAEVWQEENRRFIVPVKTLGSTNTTWRYPFSGSDVVLPEGNYRVRVWARAMNGRGDPNGPFADFAVTLGSQPDGAFGLDTSIERQANPVPSERLRLEHEGAIPKVRFRGPINGTGTTSMFRLKAVAEWEPGLTEMRIVFERDATGEFWNFDEEKWQGARTDKLISAPDGEAPPALDWELWLPDGSSPPGDYRLTASAVGSDGATYQPGTVVEFVIFAGE